MTTVMSTLCIRERIRECRRQAVKNAEASFKGTHEQARREEWGESRKRHGWSKRLVDEATAGGPLAALRSVIRHGVESLPRDLDEKERRRILRAVPAVAMIDSGTKVECHAPYYGPDAVPLQRRTYAPLRLRAL